MTWNFYEINRADGGKLSLWIETVIEDGLPVVIDVDVVRYVPGHRIRRRIIREYEQRPKRKRAQGRRYGVAVDETDVIV